MKENVAYLLGIVAGLAAVGIICWVKKRGRKEADYDERQYQTRDRACRYGFLTLLLYELVYGALYMKEAPSWCDLYYKHVDTLCMYPHAYFYYNKRRIRLVRWDIAPVF